MRIHPLFIKWAGEALIPLLGFFAWDWSLYFILLFYLLDVLANEVLIHCKTLKIKRYSEKVDIRRWCIYGSIGALGFFGLSAAIHFGMKYYHPEIDFGKEGMAFLSYTEMGVAQGYILVPLVALASYLSYKTEFIRPGKFRTEEYELMWKQHVIRYAILIAFSVLLAALARAFQLSESVLLFVIILGTTGFKWVEAKRIGLF